MPSILGDSLRRLVRGERDRDAALGDRQAEVIAVCAQKGGVGKTTTAVALATGLATHLDKKVLLVDVDAQGHCSSALHSVVRGVAGESLSGVLLGRRRQVQEVALPTTVKNLWITPPDKDLGATEGVMMGKIGKELLLKKALKQTATHYDVIIIDCPPNLGNLTVNALMAASWVLVPLDMSVLALEGVDDIFETLETLEDTLGHEPQVLGVLRTRYDARNIKVNERVEEALSSRYGRHLFETRVPVNTALAQAQAQGEPIWQFDGTCRGAKAYRKLIDELVVRMGL